MTNQDDQNHNKVHTALTAYKDSNLSFVGCENCSSCCDGTRFLRASVLLSEMNDMAKLFPVVFLPIDAAPKIKMRLIFSVKRGVPCIFHDAGIKKCTIYDSVRPGICSSYPFERTICTTEGSKKHYTFTFDSRCKGVQKFTEGINILTDDGNISKEVLDNFFGHEIFANYEKNLSATNNFLKLVGEFDLLVKTNIVIGKKPLPGIGLQDAIYNFLKISEQKLAELDADSMIRLQAAGYIDIINMHLKSLSNFRKLIRAVTAFEKSREPIVHLHF